MGSQPTHRERSKRFVVAVVVAVGLVAVTVTASAASLGGINGADLLVQSDIDSVPLPLAFDHFDDCGGSLDGDVDVVGNNWLALTSDWRCQAGNSRVRNRNQATFADSATVDVGESDQVVISTFIERTSRAKSGAGSGVSLFHDGVGFHMYIVYQRGADQITLGTVDSSGDTEVASWSWLPRSQTIEFVIEIDQPAITIYADGSLLSTYTMTDSEVATFGSNTRFGLESDFDRRSRWSWFQVEDLAP